jgi:hypothetical protein
MIAKKNKHSEYTRSHICNVQRDSLLEKSMVIPQFAVNSVHAAMLPLRSGIVCPNVIGR